VPGGRRAATRAGGCGVPATPARRSGPKQGGRWLVGWQRPGHPPVLACAFPNLRPSNETPRPLSLASPRGEEPDRVVRVASAAVAGFKASCRCPLLIFPDANSGLVGCLGSSDVEFDRGCSLETAPANPRQAQTTKVCATARVLRLPSGRLLRPAGSPGEPFLAQRCAGQDVLRGSAPRYQLCFLLVLLWRSPPPAQGDCILHATPAFHPRHKQGIQPQPVAIIGVGFFHGMALPAPPSRAGNTGLARDLMA